MSRKKITLGIIPLLISICSSLTANAKIDFAHEVVPLLKKHCIECHGGDKSKGGFSLNTRALALDSGDIVPGKPDQSLILEYLVSDDEDEKMPPPKENKKPLSEKEVEIFRRWIKDGLPWAKDFTFAKKRYETPLKPRTVNLPADLSDSQAIDYLTKKYLKKNKINTPSLVDDLTFLRRLHLDITGLPPTKDTIALLESGKLDRTKAIDLVLEDNQKYAEHWMVFWNDLLRNEYAGTGFIDGGRMQVTSWLYKSLLENKPYNTFVHQLVSPTKESAGFTKGIKWRGNVNASQTAEIQFSQNISQVFLGINMKCASCHDSFIDKWTLNDAYGLAAVASEKPLPIFRCDKETGKTAKPSWIFPELGNIDPSLPPKKRLVQLADLMTHPENGRMQRTIVNRMWRQLMGRGIVHPVDSMSTEPWSEELLDHLANTLVKNDFNIKATLKVILKSDVYRMTSENIKQSKAGAKFLGPVRRRLTAEQFLDAIRTTIEVWPTPKPKSSAFRLRRQQGGQLQAVMKAHGLKQWDNRPIRTTFTKRDKLQASLGRPNREQVVTSRPNLITTLEAINLANGEQLSSLLAKGAKQLMAKYKKAELIDHVYNLALSRQPSKNERHVSNSLIGETLTQQGVEDFLWVIFMLPEFNYVN